MANTGDGTDAGTTASERSAHRSDNGPGRQPGTRTPPQGDREQPPAPESPAQPSPTQIRESGDTTTSSRDVVARPPTASEHPEETGSGDERQERPRTVSEEESTARENPPERRTPPPTSPPPPPPRPVDEGTPAIDVTEERSGDGRGDRSTDAPPPEGEQPRSEYSGSFTPDRSGTSYDLGYLTGTNLFGPHMVAAENVDTFVTDGLTRVPTADDTVRDRITDALADVFRQYGPRPFLAPGGHTVRVQSDDGGIWTAHLDLNQVGDGFHHVPTDPRGQGTETKFLRTQNAGTGVNANESGSRGGSRSVGAKFTANPIYVDSVAGDTNAGPIFSIGGRFGVGVRATGRATSDSANSDTEVWQLDTPHLYAADLDMDLTITPPVPPTPPAPPPRTQDTTGDAQVTTAPPPQTQDTTDDTRTPGAPAPHTSRGRSTNGLVLNVPGAVVDHPDLPGTIRVHSGPAPAPGHAPRPAVNRPGVGAGHPIRLGDITPAPGGTPRAEGDREGDGAEGGDGSRSPGLGPWIADHMLGGHKPGVVEWISDHLPRGDRRRDERIRDFRDRIESAFHNDQIQNLLPQMSNTPAHIRIAAPDGSERILKLWTVPTLYTRKDHSPPLVDLLHSNTATKNSSSTVTRSKGASGMLGGGFGVHVDLPNGRAIRLDVPFVEYAFSFGSNVSNTRSHSATASAFTHNAPAYAAYDVQREFYLQFEGDDRIHRFEGSSIDLLTAEDARTLRDQVEAAGTARTETPGTADTTAATGTTDEPGRSTATDPITADDADAGGSDLRRNATDDGEDAAPAPVPPFPNLREDHPTDLSGATVRGFDRAPATTGAEDTTDTAATTGTAGTENTGGTTTTEADGPGDRTAPARDDARTVYEDLAHGILTSIAERRPGLVIPELARTPATYARRPGKADAGYFERSFREHWGLRRDYETARRNTIRILDAVSESTLKSSPNALLGDGIPVHLSETAAIDLPSTMTLKEGLRPDTVTVRVTADAGPLRHLKESEAGSGARIGGSAGLSRGSGRSYKHTITPTVGMNVREQTGSDARGVPAKFGTPSASASGSFGRGHSASQGLTHSTEERVMFAGGNDVWTADTTFDARLYEHDDLGQTRNDAPPRTRGVPLLGDDGLRTTMTLTTPKVASPAPVRATPPPPVANPTRLTTDEARSMIRHGFVPTRPAAGSTTTGTTGTEGTTGPATTTVTTDAANPPVTTASTGDNDTPNPTGTSTTSRTPDAEGATATTSGTPGTANPAATPGTAPPPNTTAPPHPTPDTTAPTGPPSLAQRRAREILRHGGTIEHVNTDLGGPNRPGLLQRTYDSFSVGRRGLHEGFSRKLEHTLDGSPSARNQFEDRLSGMGLATDHSATSPTGSRMREEMSGGLFSPHDVRTTVATRVDLESVDVFFPVDAQIWWGAGTQVNLSTKDTRSTGVSSRVGSGATDNPNRAAGDDSLPSEALRPIPVGGPAFGFTPFTKDSSVSRSGGFSSSVLFIPQVARSYAFRGSGHVTQAFEFLKNWSIGFTVPWNTTFSGWRIPVPDLFSGYVHSHDAHASDLVQDAVTGTGAHPVLGPQPNPHKPGGLVVRPGFENAGRQMRPADPNAALQNLVDDLARDGLELTGNSREQLLHDLTTQLGNNPAKAVPVPVRVRPIDRTVHTSTDAKVYVDLRTTATRTEYAGFAADYIESRSWTDTRGRDESTSTSTSLGADGTLLQPTGYDGDRSAPDDQPGSRPLFYPPSTGVSASTGRSTGHGHSEAATRTVELQMHVPYAKLTHDADLVLTLELGDPKPEREQSGVRNPLRGGTDRTTFTGRGDAGQTETLFPFAYLTFTPAPTPTTTTGDDQDTGTGTDDRITEITDTDGAPAPAPAPRTTPVAAPESDTAAPAPNPESAPESAPDSDASAPAPAPEHPRSTPRASLGDMMRTWTREHSGGDPDRTAPVKDAVILPTAVLDHGQALRDTANIVMAKSLGWKPPADAVQDGAYTPQAVAAARAHVADQNKLDTRHNAIDHSLDDVAVQALFPSAAREDDGVEMLDIGRTKWSVKALPDMSDATILDVVPGTRISDNLAHGGGQHGSAGQSSSVGGSSDPVRGAGLSTEAAHDYDNHEGIYTGGLGVASSKTDGENAGAERPTKRYPQSDRLRQGPAYLVEFDTTWAIGTASALPTRTVWRNKVTGARPETGPSHGKPARWQIGDTPTRIAAWVSESDAVAMGVVTREQADGLRPVFDALQKASQKFADAEKAYSDARAPLEGLADEVVNGADRDAARQRYDEQQETYDQALNEYNSAIDRWVETLSRSRRTFGNPREMDLTGAAEEGGGSGGSRGGVALPPITESGGETERTPDTAPRSGSLADRFRSTLNVEAPSRPAQVEPAAEEQRLRDRARQLSDRAAGLRDSEPRARDRVERAAADVRTLARAIEDLRERDVPAARRDFDTADLRRARLEVEAGRARRDADTASDRAESTADAYSELSERYTEQQGRADTAKADAERAGERADSAAVERDGAQRESDARRDGTARSEQELRELGERIQELAATAERTRTTYDEALAGSATRAESEDGKEGGDGPRGTAPSASADTAQDQRAGGERAAPSEDPARGREGDAPSPEASRDQRETVQDRERAAATAAEELGNAREEFDRRARDLADRRHGDATAEERVRTLRDRAEELRRAAEQAGRDRDAAQKAADDLRSTRDTAQRNAEAAADRARTLEARADGLEADLGRARTEAADARAHRDALTGRLADAETDLAARTVELRNARDALAALTDAVRDLERQATDERRAADLLRDGDRGTDSPNATSEDRPASSDGRGRRSTDVTGDRGTGGESSRITRPRVMMVHSLPEPVGVLGGGSGPGDRAQGLDGGSGSGADTAPNEQGTGRSEVESLDGRDNVDWPLGSNETVDAGAAGDSGDAEDTGDHGNTRGQEDTGRTVGSRGHEDTGSLRNAGITEGHRIPRDAGYARDTRDAGGTPLSLEELLGRLDPKSPSPLSGLGSKPPLFDPNGLLDLPFPPHPSTVSSDEPAQTGGLPATGSEAQRLPRPRPTVPNATPTPVPAPATTPPGGHDDTAGPGVAPAHPHGADAPSGAWPARPAWGEGVEPRGMRDGEELVGYGQGAMYLSLRMPPPALTDTEASAVRDLTGGRSDATVNDVLRGGTGPGSRARETADTLDSVIDRSALPDPLVLHHRADPGFAERLGVSPTDPDSMLGLVGRTYTDPGYTTTTTGERPLDHRHPIDVVIRVPEGYPALNTSDTSSGTLTGDGVDVLLRRGTTFVVHDVRPVHDELYGNEHWLLEAEVVPDGWSPPADWRSAPRGSEGGLPPATASTPAAPTTPATPTEPNVPAAPTAPAINRDGADDLVVMSAFTPGTGPWNTGEPSAEPTTVHPDDTDMDDGHGDEPSDSDESDESDGSEDSDDASEGDGEVLTGDDDVRNELGPAPVWHGLPHEPGGVGMAHALRFADDAGAAHWADTYLPRVSDPTAAEAVSDHTSADYTLAREGLRHGNVGVYRRDDFTSLVRNVDRALTETPLPVPLIVHKGADSGFTDRLGIDLNDPATLTGLVGTVHTEPSYISTSLGSRTPYDRPLYFMFRVPQGFPGLNAAPLSHASGERGILIPRNSSFVVHGVYQRPGRRAEDGPVEPLWFVEAEFVPDGWRPPEGWRPSPAMDADAGYREHPAPPLPGVLGPDGVRRFRSDAEGEAYGEGHLSHPGRRPGAFGHLPPDQQDAVVAYTERSSPYNQLLRTPEEERPELLESWMERGGDGWELYLLAGGRTPTVEDVLAAAARPDTLSPAARSVVEEIAAAPDPAAELAMWRGWAGLPGHLVDLFGHLPTLDDLHARIGVLDAAIGSSPLPEAIVTHRGLSRADFLTGFSGDPGSLVGTAQYEPGYLSTSLGTGVLGYAGGYVDPVQIHFTLPPGTHALWVGRNSRYPTQRELILARGTTYFITAFRQRPDGTLDLFADVLPPPPVPTVASDGGAVEDADAGTGTEGASAHG
ncbi:ADP-ribosyltransferase [Nocardiopsis sp. NRRL B-16309]|uniref:ADP-ribosyltransferase n=1 Tax=Nocardiopsis sp. NRRL B-16309 TaxID=1519494 RepID=UPI0006AD8670|nr:ADP-ribosyltransferase [Nocardiopsis sp. NRRL B-16309]KOX11979.1 hypothetical protein ADL05_22560 [Nocardiopsis sp. NRRL B-16309]